MLSAEALRELDEALQLQVQEVEDEAIGRASVTTRAVAPATVPQAASEVARDEEAPSGSSSGAAAARAPSAPEPGQRSSLVFHRAEGVVGVARAQRAGVRCMHCGDQVEKGSFRLQYVHKANKPAKSLHTTCVLQLPEDLVESSIRFLEGAARGSSDREEQAACEEASALLRSRL